MYDECQVVWYAFQKVSSAPMACSNLQQLYLARYEPVCNPECRAQNTLTIPSHVHNRDVKSQLID